MGQSVVKLAVLAALAATARADTLAGRVVEDHTGNPLASVEVKIFRTGSRYLAADLETDPEGKFEAPGLPAGEYRIEAAKANYVPSTVRPRSANATLLVRLVRCGIITGQVSDAQGQPLTGATVYALPKPAGGGPFRPFVELGQGNYTLVDEQGQYRLFNLPPGEYAVAVAYGASTLAVGSSGSARVHPGVGCGVQIYPVSTRPQIFPVSGGEEYANIDFSIAPGAVFTVSGKVDAPPGVYWVALTPVDSPALAAAVTQSERNGTFKLEGVPPGSYQITGAGPSNARSAMGGIMGKDPLYGRSRVDVGGDTEGVTITLQKGRTATVVLRVEELKDAPQGAHACPATAEVAISPLEDWAAYLQRTVPVSVGQPQTIDNLAPARYRMTAAKLGDACYQAAEAVLDLTGSASPTAMPVMVAAAGSIRGQLEGTPSAEDWTVTLVAADPLAGEQPVRAALPDAEGKFTFAGLQPGRYRIAAQRVPAGGPAARWVSGAGMTEIQVAAGKPTEIKLPLRRP